MVAKNVAAVLAFILLIAVATVAITSSFGYLESIDTCNNCHTMQPYVESFKNPMTDSIISRHSNITCIDCHGGTTYKHRLDAQLTVAKKIGVYALISNVSDVNTSFLGVNCIDCHPTIGDSIAHRGNTSCGNCHLAHRDTLLPQEFNELECSKCHKLPEGAGKHLSMDCRACHIRHKYKPNCTQCHPPHTKAGMPSDDMEDMTRDWANDVCLGCHKNYHSPNVELQFDLSPNMDKELCAGCHVEYNILSIYGSSHNYLMSCALCHNRHGVIDVRDCNTAYCHGGLISYNEKYYKYKDKSDIVKHDKSSMCRTCHGQKSLKPHYYAAEHETCENCHGPPHMAVHAKTCQGCHLQFSSCRDCHQENIHKLKA